MCAICQLIIHGPTTDVINILLHTLPVAPTSLVAPMNLTITEGENATFTCRVTGRPIPTIAWIYQESPLTMPNMSISPLSENMDYAIDSLEMGDQEIESNLTVLTTLPSDTGFYACVADNEVEGRELIQNAFLSVQGKQIGTHNNTWP